MIFIEKKHSRNLTDLLSQLLEACYTLEEGGSYVLEGVQMPNAHT